jgi:hypothetical protein
MTSHIKRFGDYLIDAEAIPEPYESDLALAARQGKFAKNVTQLIDKWLFIGIHLSELHVSRLNPVLGLNESHDRALADTLKEIAVKAGLDATSFIVRFLPDEPSHREDLVQAGMTPFYQRPGAAYH